MTEKQKEENKSEPIEGLFEGLKTRDNFIDSPLVFWHRNVFESTQSNVSLNIQARHRPRSARQFALGVVLAVLSASFSNKV